MTLTNLTDFTLEVGKANLMVRIYTNGNWVLLDEVEGAEEHAAQGLFETTESYLDVDLYTPEMCGLLQPHIIDPIIKAVIGEGADA